MAPARMRSRPSSGSSPSWRLRSARMKENSPICASEAEIMSAAERECPKRRTTRKAAIDLPTRMMSTVASSATGASTTIVGVEQHADRDEEQHGEGVAQGQRLGRGLLAQLRLAQHHAGEEGAERERDAEQLGCCVSHAERDGEHGKPEQLAASGMGDIMQDRRDQLLADDQHDGDEDARICRAGWSPSAQHRRHRARSPRRETGRQTWQQHEHQHHGDVLHDQPADGDPPALGLDQSPLL